jgi:hypothetical protein
MTAELRALDAEVVDAPATLDLVQAVNHRHARLCVTRNRLERVDLLGRPHVADGGGGGRPRRVVACAETADTRRTATDCTDDFTRERLA